MSWSCPPDDRFSVIRHLLVLTALWIPASCSGSQAAEVESRLAGQLRPLLAAHRGKVAVAVSTLWRDEYAADALAPHAAPLYIDDARGAPLALGELQYVGRWISTGVMQYNPVTSVPQEFAGRG